MVGIDLAAIRTWVVNRSSGLRIQATQRFWILIDPISAGGIPHSLQSSHGSIDSMTYRIMHTRSNQPPGRSEASLQAFHDEADTTAHSQKVFPTQIGYSSIKESEATPSQGPAEQRSRFEYDSGNSEASPPRLIISTRLSTSSWQPMEFRCLNIHENRGRTILFLYLTCARFSIKVE